jgi:hypothetical protein
MEKQQNLVVVEFVKTDFIGGIAYSIGEIAGWPAHVAERLIKKGYAVLYGDGRPKVAGGRIPNAKDWFDEPALNDHVAKLKKAGEWPAHLDAPVVIGQPEITPSTQYGG